MKYTEKHDKDLIDKVIKKYRDYIKEPDIGGICNVQRCAFCIDARSNKRVAISYECDDCVLVRRFHKRCNDYISFDRLDGYWGFDSNYSEKFSYYIKIRIGVLKRLKHYIKGEINV